MGCVITYLFVQIKTKNQILGQGKNFFAKETRIIVFILILFNMSYLIRFIWDITRLKWQKFGFVFHMSEDLVYLLSDGLTMFALLILHRRSFLT